MQILSLFNIKGGVGKTASAVNLAYLAARAGRRTLLWDLDPQGAATFYFRIQPRVEGGGKRLILGRSELVPLLRGSDFEGLDVLPADFSYRKMDAALARTDAPDEHLARLLEPLRERYDVLFIDCAPNLSRLSEGIFEASDAILTPTIPTTLSLRTLAQLMKHLKDRKGRRPPSLPFFCMVDLRRRLHQNVCTYVEEQGLGFLRSRIPYSSLVEQMGTQRNPIFAYAPSSPPARAYEELWEELEERTRAERGAPRFLKRAQRALLEEAGRLGPGTRGRARTEPEAGDGPVGT